MKRLVVAVLGAALLAGCVGKPDVLPLGEVTGELTILAEDSLGVVFGELGDLLEAEPNAQALLRRGILEREVNDDEEGL